MPSRHRKSARALDPERAAREAAMREYLSWEVDLVRQVERDGDARFRVLT